MNLPADSFTFSYIILPLLIILARIIDVSIGTLRIIYVSKGMKYIAPILGFFEVLIWLLAIGQIMQNLDNWVCYAAYGLGFALGNYVGILLEKKLKMGTYIIRIITQKGADELCSALYRENYGITRINAEGSTGPVEVLYMIIRRKNIMHVERLIEQHNPNAFYTIEDVRFVSQGIFPPSHSMRDISNKRIRGLMRH